MIVESPFPSRRSAVMSNHGIVATSQPLAAQAGISMLLNGGNAIDAAIATAAALNVVEPMSTGLGGDAFALVYLSKIKKVHALNASGRAPYACTVEKMRSLGYDEMPSTGIHTVTIPGSLDGWCSLLDAYGTMTLSQVLAPALILAEDGFPVTERIAYVWQKNTSHLNPAARRTYMPDRNAPEPGQIFKQPDLARSLKKIAEGGHNVFYHGDIAEAIIAKSPYNGKTVDRDEHVT